MNKKTTISPEVARLIPHVQLEITRKHSEQFGDCLNRLATALEKCPTIGGVNDSKEHPCMFHYFCGSTDIYISEYDKENEMFGYTILNGDVQFSEWGYTNLSEITRIPSMNIDYYFPEQTIEAILYESYPDFFKKPESLKLIEV